MRPTLRAGGRWTFSLTIALAIVMNFSLYLIYNIILGKNVLQIFAIKRYISTGYKWAFPKVNFLALFAVKITKIRTTILIEMAPI